MKNITILFLTFTSIANATYIQENAGQINKSKESSGCNRLTTSIAAHKKKTVKEIGSKGFDCRVLAEGVVCVNGDWFTSTNYFKTLKECQKHLANISK